MIKQSESKSTKEHVGLVEDWLSKILHKKELFRFVCNVVEIISVNTRFNDYNQDTL